MHFYNLQKFQFINELNINLISKDTTNLSIIYRNYSKDIKSKELIEIKKFCKKKSIKFFISNKIDECLKYDLDGLYIPSFNKQNLTKKLKLHKQTIIGSAHNHIEIRKKVEQGCKIIFLSPLFKTYKTKFLGVSKFNLIKMSFKEKFVALGGINKNNICKTKMLDIYGISGISMYKKKPAFFKAGFNKL
jgi:thiamine-phosphate pyrophosphorylase